MEQKLIRIKPSQVVGRKENIRFKTDSENSVREMADNLILIGQQQPIVVEPAEKEGQYILVFGNRRLDAALHIVKTGQDRSFQLDAIVRDPSDADTLIRRQFAENVLRKQLTPMDFAVSAKRLSDEGRKQAEVADIMGVSQASVRDFLVLADAPTQIQRKLHDGSISQESAVALARRAAASDKDKEKAIAVLHKMEEKAKEDDAKERERVKKLAEEAKAAGDKAKAAKLEKQAKEAPPVKAGKKHLAQAEKEIEAKATTGVALRISAVKEDFRTQDGPGTSAAVRNIIRAEMAYFAGDLDLDGLMKVMESNVREDAKLSSKYASYTEEDQGSANVASFKPKKAAA